MLDIIRSKINKTRNYLLGIFTIGLFIPKMIDWLSDLDQFAIHKWAYVWNLPVSSGKYNIIIYWNYLLVNTLAFEVIGKILTIMLILVLIFLIATEPFKKEDNNNELI